MQKLSLLLYKSEKRAKLAFLFFFYHLFNDALFFVRMQPYGFIIIFPL